jgi:hypothetical protein
MGTKKAISVSESLKELPPDERKYCPNCIRFFDGKPVISIDGNSERVNFAPYPGMQFHQYSKGSIYARIGVLIPCTCDAGLKVAAGYKYCDGREIKPWFSIKNGDIILGEEQKKIKENPIKITPQRDFFKIGELL